MKRNMKTTSHEHTHSEEFFSPEEIEKIFVKGSAKLIGVKRKDDTIPLSQSFKISGSILGGLESSKVTKEEFDSVKKWAGKFYHWFEHHEGDHPSEGDIRITYGHHEKIIPVGGGDGYFDCNLLADEWFKWFLTTPRSRNPFSRPGRLGAEQSEIYGADNAFLFQKRGIGVYLTTASPFQVPPDLKTINLTSNVPILVPVYNVCMSTELYPSLRNETDLLQEVIRDLLGIYPKSVNAKIDGQTIEPCCVIRKKLLRVDNIPDDNVAGLPKDRLDECGKAFNIVYGGFWMLIRKEILTSGDHLLEWTVESPNYKNYAQISINTLV